VKAPKGLILFVLEGEELEKLERFAKIEGLDRNEAAKKLLLQALNGVPRLGPVCYTLLQLQKNRPKPLMMLLKLYGMALRRQRRITQEVVSE